MPKKVPSPVFGLIDEFAAELESLGELLIPDILSRLDRGVPPRLAVNQSFNKFNVVGEIRDSILDKMVTAAAIGYGVKEVAKPTALKRTFLNRFWSGEKSLSQTITAQEYKQVIINSVQSGLREADTFTTIAKSLSDSSIFDWKPSGNIQARVRKQITLLSDVSKIAGKDSAVLRREIQKAKVQVSKLSLGGAPNQTLKAAYNKLISDVEKGKIKSLEKNMEIAVFEKGRYNAERIARTSISDAHSLSHDFKAHNNPDVLAIKYTLSTRHPEYDICDFHTSANLYGMGPGVYPKNKKPPHTFHPHCLCVPSDVFRTEVELNNTFDNQSAESFINSQPKSNQVKLLGVGGRKEWLNNKDSWNKHLKNWRGQEKPDFTGLTVDMYE